MKLLNGQRIWILFSDIWNKKTHYHLFKKLRWFEYHCHISFADWLLFSVCFCSEHDKELETLQAAFEQAICYLSKSTYLTQLWNKQCFAVSCNISALFSSTACIQQNVAVSQLIVWCWWWCIPCVSHFQWTFLSANTIKLLRASEPPASIRDRCSFKTWHL